MGSVAADLVPTLEELNHLGVGFVSLTEALDLTTPTGRAMAGLLSSLRLRTRDPAGTCPRGYRSCTAKRQAAWPPARLPAKAAEIRKLYRAGISKAEIARQLNIGRTSVRRILAHLNIGGNQRYLGLTQGHRKLTVQ